MAKLLNMAMFCLLMLGIGSAKAIPVTYTLSGTATGDLAGVSFAQATFSLSGLGDSDALEEPETGVSLVALQYLTIELDGVGTFDALNETYFFSNRNVALAGFLDLVWGDIVDLAGPFSDYDGISSLGPETVTGEFFGQFDTTGGLMSFTQMHDLVLQVSGEVPEPNSLLLLATAVLALAAYRKIAR